tara:strand:+ start:10976 stop:12334 length:1359 start_codon:yes stop_codon:yes gene_type:complete
LKKIFIITLALYQTKFWFKVFKDNKDENFKFIIISFDSESTFFLKKNFPENYIDASNFIKSKKKIYSINEFKKKIRNRKIFNFNKILNHEKIFYGKRNNLKLLSKYLNTLDFFFENEKFQDYKNIIFIQEIGGFIPNICTYEFCKIFKINHYFLEGSFFSNYFHVVKNNYLCEPLENKTQDINFDLEKYLKFIKNKNVISIPIKDKKHFKNPLKKLLDPYNIYRFFEKNFKKYFLNYKFVFGSDILVLKQNLINLINYFYLKKKYLNLYDENFIYFPLHVPNDYALTIRSSNYQDQLDFINKISKFFYPEKVFIKEHPARIGSISYKSIKKLLKNNDNLRILNPMINNYEVIKKCKFLITINSKAGYEGILLKKHIFSFGDSYYKKSNLVKYCENIEDIHSSKEYLNKKIYEKEIINFFNNIKTKSFKGSLYDLNFDNINHFKKSIENITND